MSPNVLKMKPYLSDLTLNGYAWLGTLVSWSGKINQPDVEFFLRTLMTGSAIALTIVTIYYKIKNKGK